MTNPRTEMITNGRRGSKKARSGLEAAAFLAIAMAFLAMGASCSGSLDAAVKADGSAVVAVSVRVPDGIAAKIREQQNAGTGAAPSSAPLFDPARFRKDIAARTGISISSISLPDINSLSTVLAVKNLKATVDADFAPSGIATLTVSGGTSTLTISLNRSNAEALNKLAPGLDPDIIAILNPPSLDNAPVTKEEYRLNLVAILGEKNARNIDATTISFSIKIPGTISAVTGSMIRKTSSTQAIATIPLLDLLVLENPLLFSISWK